MLPLATQIRIDEATAERRAARRHPLALKVGPSRAVIENLSETGLALHAHSGLRVGDTIEIDLPVAGPTTASVAWSEAELIGCEFASPISKAAVSAARLQSPFEQPALTENPVVAWTRGHGPAMPDYRLAIALMLAGLLVAAMFTAAMLTAPFTAV